MAAPRPLAVERAARRDLERLPDVYRNSAVGKAYLAMARMLDGPYLEARDTATIAREMRLSLLTLFQLAPPESEEDFVDNAVAGRERRLASVSDLDERRAAHDGDG